MNKKMYQKPQTEAISVAMTSSICSASQVYFKPGDATGPGLAPKRTNAHGNPNY